MSTSEIASYLGLGKTSVLKYAKLPLGETPDLPSLRGDLVTKELRKTLELKGTRLKTFVVSPRDEFDELMEEARRIVPPSRLAPVDPPRGNVLVISLSDCHLGKLCISKETGDAPYDLGKAVELHDEALAYLITNSAHLQYEQIVLVVGNDLMHVDTPENETTAGTRQDVSTRYCDIYTETRKMVARSINLCRNIAPVHVVMVPGNHDFNSTWHLGDSLQCLFVNASDVTIDNQPSAIKYHSFGETMWQFVHGDGVKKGKLPLLMASHQRQMWGSTRFHEVFTGHLHGEELEQNNGVKVRTMASLTPADFWHSKMGYIGNVRSATAYMYNRIKGLVGTSQFTADEENY